MSGRLSPLEVQVLARLRRALEDRFGERLVRLVLFGSRARGGGRDDSDLDVLVLVDRLDRQDRRAVIDLCADLELDSGLSLSPLCADAAAFRWDLPLGASIAREGVAL